MREIRVGVTNPLVAWVDDEDYLLVAQYVWYRHVRPHTIYAIRRWGTKGHYHYQLMHNLIMGFVGVDHRDHNGLNNQHNNLRDARAGGNERNRRKPKSAKTSSFKGVCLESASGRWLAQIYVAGDGRKGNLKLGRFDSEEEAARAYDRAATEHFGEFALLNFTAEAVMEEVMPGARG